MGWNEWLLLVTGRVEGGGSETEGKCAPPVKTASLAFCNQRMGTRISVRCWARGARLLSTQDDTVSLLLPRFRPKPTRNTR
jgi:hypothetical protein